MRPTSINLKMELIHIKESEKEKKRWRRSWQGEDKNLFPKKNL